jgi:hypothetical protein
MIRFTLFGSLSIGLLGCARQPPEPPQAAVAVPVEAKPAAPVHPNDSDVAPVESHYPLNVGARVVEQAVAPDTPALTPAERFGTAPAPRVGRVAVPEPVAKAKYTLPPVPPAKAANVALGQPPERVPPDLGNGATAVPAKPTLPVAAGITERARDVNLPPAMPILGRPAADRVGLDDPTAELGHAAVANPPVKVALTPAAFLKVALPDPFEYGEQVRPKVPPAAEPGLTPVPVDPRRVK